MNNDNTLNPKLNVGIVIRGKLENITEFQSQLNDVLRYYNKDDLEVVFQTISGNRLYISENGTKEEK